MSIRWVEGEAWVPDWLEEPPCPHDDTLDGPCPGGPGHTDPWPFRAWDRLTRHGVPAFVFTVALAVACFFGWLVVTR